MSQNWTPPAPPTASATVPNYLVWAIVSICGCGWPLAIPAIIFATQVNSKLAAGDIAGAQDASKKAKLFAMIAIGCDILFWIGMIIYFVFVVGVVALSGSSR
ncbi:MAG TPA: CD225/dispanin family protein [Pyrinomonadaceae bacterium]|nr:CD225/dispanin family protein [Pyrinomonadaceae bacterium]